MLVSDCCGSPVYNTDCDICPDCKEHCEFVDDEEIIEPENKNQ